MSNKLTIETLKKIKGDKPTGKLTSTLGAIVDSTNPHRNDLKKDFCMRLKVTDQTFAKD
jgi:hypothetical protein